ncbi:phenylpyruvate tautomerase MIF-related protein [Paludicola sp. MB14-C6]|uniref:phenylpyruvate tautomerase MIF-related protein n=1 Tax=Paludihabitans sp. MB14-C6 TaxID=3070656 RepID=UPI0027DD0D0B|nr:phenylpyruvate tautomerase MIF-related protein [Paludicola sp. MB14-C6]WMJ23868.1 phenylpyruvate tautomerase MIF-related protein [Paludicola sp. MB14-C6]
MPFIQTKVNVKIEKAQEERIKTKLGKAIELIPGKSENWLMLGFEDECSLYFKGSNQKPIAFVEVKLFGKASSDAYNKLTAAITDILEDELNIASDCCYVKYEEVSNWGWNGNNF